MVYNYFCVYLTHRKTFPMTNSFPHTSLLKEGIDFFVKKKGYFTFFYFQDFSKAQYLREQLSNKSNLKEIHLTVISKVTRSTNVLDYFFFVSEERLI